MINIDIVYPIRNLILPNVWMEGDKGKVEERGGEDDRDILKVSTFHEVNNKFNTSIIKSHTLVLVFFCAMGTFFRHVLVHP